MKGFGVMFAFVMLGAFAGAILGYGIGIWLGDLATRNCLEMDCLDGLLWGLGGILVGAIAGGVGGGLGARRYLRTHPPDTSR